MASCVMNPKAAMDQPMASREGSSVPWGVHLPSHHQNFVTFLVGDIDGYIAITWKGTTQSIIQYLKDVAEKEV